MSAPLNNVNRLVPGLIEKVTPAGDKTAPKSEGTSFGEELMNVLNSVNDLQSEAGQAQEAFLNGEPVELHEVMIKAEEAGLAMDLLLEIRNRLVEGYQEIMRMPM